MKGTLVSFILMLSVSMSCFSKDAPALAPETERADRIHVVKSQRLLRLYRNDTVIGTYKIRMGKSPRGHKEREGDERTPEGAYQVASKNPNSKWHLSLEVSYPNERDRRRADELGVSPGKDIMIHGGNAFWRPLNWTDGCIAVNDKEIEEIWRLVAVGTPILISP